MIGPELLMHSAIFALLIIIQTFISIDNQRSTRYDFISYCKIFKYMPFRKIQVIK